MFDQSNPSRRMLLRRVPVVAVATLTPALPAIAAADPYVHWHAEMVRRWDASNASFSEEHGNLEFKGWDNACDQLMRTKPTSLRGVSAGLKAILHDHLEFHGDIEEGDAGDRLRIIVLRNVIEFLDRNA